jgi:threonyl-tRNA synthetase
MRKKGAFMKEEKNEQEMIGRHSLAHVMAKAVSRIFPSAKPTIGPSIDDGFYYDFDMTTPFSLEDLTKIEKEMTSIINKNESFRREVVSKEKAKEIFKNNQYKLELINELPDSEEKSLYYLGDDFVDLCRGPHVENTSKLQNFGYKLVKINGAYWRGNEKNKMLQRIYAYAFKDKKALSEYTNMLEEALKRDHNKIGRELEYFTTVDYIGQGLPIMLPKGAKTIQIMQRFVEDEECKRGYLLTKTPFLSKNDLFKISGHWDHYKESMFILGEEQKDKEVYCLRPMTCPFQYQVFLNKARSYRDLPMRLGETSTLFRKEASGECHGLIRLRQFTISEGHLIVMPEQLEEEFKGCVDLAAFMLNSLGLDEDVSYRFSKWDENNKKNTLGQKKNGKKFKMK